MKKPLISFFAGVAAAAAFATAPQIDASSVSISQGADRLVVVEYELTGTNAIVTVDFLTNGVSIGAANFANVAGDVNRIVDPGVRKILWRADRGWTGHSADAAFTAAVRVWPLASPPDILVIDLTARLPPKKQLRFYVSEDALPDGGLANRVRYAEDCIVMKRVYAAGKTARLGCPSSIGAYAANPEYWATFTEDYYLGIYPLTVAQCKKFWECRAMADNAANNHWNNEGLQQAPVCNLSYRDLRGANKGYNWPLDGEEDGRVVDAHEVDESFLWGTYARQTGVYPLRSVSGLRRIDPPTRAQWEYAARAGSPFNFYQLDGDVAYDDLPQNPADGSREKAFAERIGWTVVTANMDGNRGYRNVGLKEPNKWGFYDMIGNIAEVVLDRSGSIPYAGTTQTDPRGPETGTDAMAMNSYIVSPPNSCRVYSVYGSAVRSARTGAFGVRFCAPVDITELAD